MTAAGPAASVRSQAAEIARGWSRPGAPASWALTAALFTTLADDDELSALAAQIPPPRLPALLFSAAACHLVAALRPPGLVDYFPDDAGSPLPPDPRFASMFRAFCLEHRAELLDLGARHRYQMNEVARSTQVGLALAALARRDGVESVALVDVGAGAGLGLHLDRYDHRLSSGTRFGDPGSPLVLHCEVAGPVPSSPRLPAIERRLGMDLAPIDLTVPEARAWARACIPPDAASLARFDAASEVARDHPCTILEGDALDLLPAVLDDLPADLPVVVVDAYTAVFFSEDERARLHTVLRRSRRRALVAWVSLDPLVPLGTAGRDSVQGLAVPSRVVAAYQRGGVFALLGLLVLGPEGEHGVVLARAHPSGTELTWMDGAHPAR